MRPSIYLGTSFLAAYLSQVVYICIDYLGIATRVSVYTKYSVILSFSSSGASEMIVDAFDEDTLYYYFVSLKMQSTIFVIFIEPFVLSCGFVHTL